MINHRIIGAFALCLAIVRPGTCRADGGTLRLSQTCGVYRVALFTNPAVLRVGGIEFCVLVHSLATREVCTDEQVAIRIQPVEGDRKIDGDVAIDRYFHRLQVNISESGRYLVLVKIGPDANVECEIDVLPPLSSWVALGPWIGWPFVVVGLFALHQVLAHRRVQRALEVL